MADKLFYTDPLAAAIMARDFGVKIQGYYNVTKNLGDVLSWENIMESRHFPKYYVHEDSYHIFEPQDGDLGVDIKGNYAEYILDEDDELYWASIDDELFRQTTAKTIQRDSKPFFNPEREV